MKKIRLLIRVFLRWLKDLNSGYKFAKGENSQPPLIYHIDVHQPFKPSKTLEAKKHNLRIASRRIERVTLLPGEVFSFWKIVGNPNRKAFRSSRSIVAGQLKIERGGGLCQVSGIVYHLALIAGLEIIERYAHSIDLYTDETRFCPLGSDATVAYGYRDLRFRNNTDKALCFLFHIDDEGIECCLHSTEPLQKHELAFDTSMLPDGRKKAVVTDLTTGQVLTTDIYEKFNQ